ncbi:MAG TPA: NAD(P)-binding protein [Thermoanaerobaculia bacterium]|nr:NAD(P)-binding protein [Thermoanaerobaculia bacterium]
MAPTSIIRIAGAGPSGLAAAIALARAGRTVVVHEAKPTVGARFIGDLQIIESYSETEPVPEMLDRFGISTDFYFRAASSSSFYDHKGRRFDVRSEQPYGYFIRRGPFEGTLDRGLLAQAENLGVEVRFGSRLRAEEADIVATGPATPDGLAREITFASSDPETIDVFFDHRLAPGGYFYLFILDGVGTFGCAIVSDFRRIDNYFEASLARVREIRPFTMEGDLRSGYSYMNFHLKQRATEGPRLFVGEAAGFQDYLFGLGLRYALTSGHLAARSILENRSFDELWKEWLGTKQKTSVANRFLYEAGRNLGLSFFTRGAARAGDLRDYLRGWHRPVWWKKLIVPLIRGLWRNGGGCQHQPGPHWCRARDTAMKVPPLGPRQQDGPSRAGSDATAGQELAQR